MSAGDRDYLELRGLITRQMKPKTSLRALELLEKIAGPPYHELELTPESTWALKHPVGCRDDMLGCVVNRKLMERDDPPVNPGRWRVDDIVGHPTELEFSSL